MSNDIDNIKIEISISQLTDLKAKEQIFEKTEKENEKLREIISYMTDVVEREHISLCKDVTQYNQIYHGGSFSASSLSDCYEPRRDSLNEKISVIRAKKSEISNLL
jgi:hypothetical protein